MIADKDMADAVENKPDFSLVYGGPIFQLLQRVHLAGDGWVLAWRRVVVVALVAWLPLLVLSALSGHAHGGGIKIPFLFDLEAHVRFLAALPILIAGELVVHSRIRSAVNRFVERHIIAPEQIADFHDAIKSAIRVRNSAFVEITLMILVYPIGFWIWSTQVATGIPSWYSMSGDSHLQQLTLAGYWYVLISLPIFQFILLRWYLRFAIWFWLLWRISRLDLRLNATHPDRAAGLGFLASGSYAFVPILFAQGAMLSGLIANRVLYDAHDLISYKLQAAGSVVFFMLFILSPLFVFSSHLSRAKRRGLSDYGELGSRYVQAFERKWLDGKRLGDEELLGSGDIQSLADLGNTFGVVAETRFVPFGVKDLVRLAAATAVPLLPLTLTVISLEELVKRLIKILL